MVIDTSGVSNEVRARILNFLNHTHNAKSIAGDEPVHGPILDDPSTGYGDNVGDYDIGIKVATGILTKRNSLPGHQFMNIAQLNGIPYLGQDKFTDLVYTFSRYWERFLAVNRLEQETNYYCGAASAQMILDFLHGWGGNPQINQDDLYETIQDHKQDNNFYTDPDGLAGCLNKESPSANRWFVYSGGDGDQEKVCRKMAVTMDTYDSPPPVLIFDGDHWVVVSGVTATESPSMAKKSFIIYTIRIHDPGIGSNVQEIEYYNWCSMYMTKNTWGQTWLDKYVCIVDPKAESNKIIKFANPNYKTGGRKTISLEEAKKFARESLDDYHLTDRKEYKESLRDASPGEPILVKNLRLKSKRSYYLVPFVRAGKTKVVVMINAYYGNYLGSSIVEKPREYLDISEKKAINQIHSNLKKKMPISKEEIRKPWLVWKPCEQSWDPFFPLWKTITKGRVRYVNQAGQVFSRMKKAKKGGM